MTLIAVFGSASENLPFNPFSHLQELSKVLQLRSVSLSAIGSSGVQ